MPRPLVPAPFEAKFTVAVPFTVPAAEVLTPINILVVLVAPAPRRLTLPLVVMRPSEVPPKLASSFSEKPSLATLLVMERACCTVSPTWTLPKLKAPALLICALAKR